MPLRSLIFSVRAPMTSALARIALNERGRVRATGIRHADPFFAFSAKHAFLSRSSCLQDVGD
jgi:hypothetical protein